MADVLPSDELIEEPSDYGALSPGTCLGRYELLVPIARGGMARVWAARLHGQRGFQKLVAIKTILPHLANEPEFERMFLDEARIASGVHHPNVCEIYELGEDGKTLYLAMEWVSGDSLSRMLRASGRTEAVDARVIARVIADACAGLHAAHELTDDLGRQLGVVHRDLSPHNILLTTDGIAKVADFGVAKALGQLHEATSAGQLKGKIHYMSPEQVTGAPIDRRSDVFSLGCVLYEATTGVRPFKGDGDHQVMHHLLKGEFEPPSAMVRGYPQELERIVQRAMSPQPLLRFPTAERMRFALEEFLARGPLVTQSNVAQVLRQRIGEHLDRRKERIRQASTAGDREGGWSEPPGASRTPAGQGAHRSGVKPSGQHALYTTMQMGPGGEPVPPSMSPSTSMHGGPPTTTMPDAPAIPADTESATAIQPAPVMGMTGGLSSVPPPPAPSSRPPATLAMQSPVAALAMPPTVPAAFTPQPPPVALPQGVVNEYAGGLPVPNVQPLTMPLDAGPTSQPHPHVAPHAFGAPYGPPPQGQPPYGAPPAEQPPASAAQYAIAAGVGVLVAVLIGVGGFFAWRAKSAPTGGATASPSASSAAPAVGSAPASASAASAASAEVLLEVVPADAIVSVDDVALSSPARNVARPPPGKIVTVVARAPGHRDATVLVDAFSKSPVRLVLEKASDAPPPVAEPAPAVDAPVPSASAAPPPAPAGGAAEAPKVDPPAGEAPKPKPRPKPAEPALPDNPY